MEFKDINPLIRFAQRFTYHSPGRCVRVEDCRIFYILAGDGRISIGGLEYRLVPGTLFFCRENSVYTILAEEITLIALNFDLCWTGQGSFQALPPRPVPSSCSVLPPCPASSPCPGEDNAESKPIPSPVPESSADSRTGCCDGGFPASHAYIQNGETYLSSLNEILSEFSIRKNYYREKAGGILKIVLTDLFRSDISSTGHSSNALSEVITYVNTHYREDLSNKQLASMAGYHEYHLNRLFLRYTGQTVHQYILSRRLEEAKRLLIATNLPLSEIAELTGFNSCSHFSAYFKKANGISPNQCRSQFQNSI